VLDDQQPAAKRRADLNGVRWCLACWDGLDERIGHARAVVGTMLVRATDTVYEGWLCGGYRFHQRLCDRPIPERMSHNATHSLQM
jgi:hypothetical protein